MGRLVEKSPSSNNIYRLLDVMTKDRTPTLITKSITQNGTYNAVNDNAEGYSSVTVNVSAEEDDGYVRPADWLTIPTMDGTLDEVYILVGVGDNQFNQIQIRVKGVCTIDWGDGTTSQSINVEQPFEHTWDPSLISSSTWTEHNKSKQVLIHIYGARGAITKISTAGTISYINEAGVAMSYPSQASTDIYHIKGNVSSAEVICCGSSSARNAKLELFEWSGAMTNTSFSYGFANAYDLVRVIGVDTSNATNCNSMFYNCRSLRTLSTLDLGKVTNASSMFNQASSIKKIKLRNANKITNANSMFSGCYSLQEFPDVDLKDATNLSMLCSSCSGLSTVPPLDVSAGTNLSAMFTGCYSLIIAPVMKTNNATTMQNMFSNCYSLTYVPTYDMRKVTEANGMFNGCYALKQFPKVNTSQCVNFTNMFNNCNTALTGPTIDMRLATSGTNNVISSSYSITKGAKLYGINPSYSSAFTLSFNSATLLTRQGCLDSFNAIAPNINGYSRTLSLSSYTKTVLNNVYVRDKGTLYTIILPTSDTSIQTGKTYYTYDENSDTYTQVTPDFTSNVIYHELITSSWNEYEFCESTDTGAMLILDFVRNIKGYTVS